LVKWLIVAAIVGAATGLVVVMFQYLALDLLWERVLAGPLWLQAAAPPVGIAVTWLVLRTARSPGPETAEEYIRVFHDRRARMRAIHLPGKLLAAMFTVGFGGSMGLEGPSLLIGGTIGDEVQRRSSRLFSSEEAKIMLVAGGAAGIAAVFKAPLTGLVFAMEVPYRDDVARHVLGPALVASASGYLVEAGLRGVEPLLPVVGARQFDARELLLSVALGLVAGLGARVVIMSHRKIGNWLRSVPPLRRIATAGIVLIGIAVASDRLFGAPLALGAGEEAIRASARGELGLALLVALILLKIVSTSVTAAAGGVGGLFFPLVMIGTALGAAFAHIASSGDTLFPLVGMASVLGGAYHTPLAGVSFMAETTGQAAFVIPTFVATAAAYATMGKSSISREQRPCRVGWLERVLEGPVMEIARLDGATVTPVETLSEFLRRSTDRYDKSFVVVDDSGRYLGVVDINQAMRTPSQQWDGVVVQEVMRADHPSGESDWTVYRGVQAMTTADVDVLPILDPQGRVVGVLKSREIFPLRQILIESPAIDDELLARMRGPDQRPPVVLKGDPEPLQDQTLDPRSARSRRRRHRII
jgi:CIC family chloride channel protein